MERQKLNWREIYMRFIWNYFMCLEPAWTWTCLPLYAWSACWEVTFLTSNSLPTNEDICSQWSLHEVLATARALCDEVHVNPSRDYKGSHYGQPTKPSVMSSVTFCSGTYCQIREEKVERSQWKPRMDKNFLCRGGSWSGHVKKTALKLISWDSVRNTMTG